MEIECEGQTAYTCSVDVTQINKREIKLETLAMLLMN